MRFPDAQQFPSAPSTDRVSSPDAVNRLTPLQETLLNVWTASIFVGWLGLLLTLGRKCLRGFRLLVLMSLLATLTGTLLVFHGTRHRVDARFAVANPLRAFRFTESESPDGYRLAAFDDGISRRLTGNPGYSRSGPEVEAVYRKGDRLLVLNAAPIPAGEFHLLRDLLSHLNDPPLRNELLVSAHWSSNVFVLCYYRHRADVDAEDFQRVQISSQRLADRLQLSTSNRTFWLVQ
jgi:hypothetical protein